MFQQSTVAQIESCLACPQPQTHPCRSRCGNGLSPSKLAESVHQQIVNGGLNPNKFGGGKWWRNAVTETGGHLWRRILVAAFGAECAINSKGSVRSPCC
jgi:hypothetical protein